MKGNAKQNKEILVSNAQKCSNHKMLVIFLFMVICIVDIGRT